MRADFIPVLGSWLLTYLLHSTLMLGAAWLVTRRLVESAAVREFIWKAALVGGVATATLQAGLGFVPLGGSVALEMAGSAAGRLAGSAEAASEPWAGLLGAAQETSEPAVGSSSSRIADSTIPGTAEPASLQAGESASRPAAVPPTRQGAEPPTWLLAAAVAAWAVVGMLLCGLYLVQRRRAMRRIGPRRQVSDAALLDMLDGLRRAGDVRRVIRLTAASGLASPVALGRDEIALPEAALTDLDPEQQRSMLAHELAHLERRDPAWLALGCVFERALFLQPLNRIARVRLQETAELLCDDWAVRRTGSGVSLASCLVKVAEWIDTTPRPVPLAGMAERRSQLVTRIHRLIEGRVMPAAPRSFWLVAVAVVLVGVTAVAAPGVTASRADLLAQDTTKARPAAEATPAVQPDSAESWYRRLQREIRLARSRARIDAKRARIEARAAIAPAPVAMPAPEPPAPPASVAPAIGPTMRVDIERALARARISLGKVSAGLHGKGRGDTTSIAVPALIAALKDPDVEVRRAAARSLSNLGDSRAILPLIEALKDGDAEVRSSAAEGLGEFDDARAIPGLSALLKDSSKDVRHAALHALEDFAEQVPDETILAALSDSDSEVRLAALNLAENRLSSGDHGERTADPRYVSAFSRLLGDSDADVRGLAASVLGEVGLREAPPALLQAAKDRNADVRQQVACALGEIRDPKTVPALKELTQDSNPEVRQQAVHALAEIRDRSALEALVSALKSSDPVVRRSAAEALGEREKE
jgi:HEAT repeat protein/beta-lactamase regulating signal transducer with metallopeptidase domain